eukprot:CAMPEP_0115044386 /NCGR_PEP_ID=MMETSP0216-20121206/47453_1 /TAXON_ID=223996 /ORGANISM="Protocruzia adherens, Strain Boccale" /LENGTH=400 /DNA_ID=CAMNT_0002426927 /DNA_START=102 /DNA_END=1304 /DNA_ORIENTATION=+
MSLGSPEFYQTNCEREPGHLKDEMMLLRQKLMLVFEQPGEAYKPSGGKKTTVGQVRSKSSAGRRRPVGLTGVESGRNRDLDFFTPKQRNFLISPQPEDFAHRTFNSIEDLENNTNEIVRKNLSLLQRHGQSVRHRRQATAGSELQSSQATKRTETKPIKPRRKKSAITTTITKQSPSRKRPIQTRTQVGKQSTRMADSSELTSPQELEHQESNFAESIIDDSSANSSNERCGEIHKSSHEEPEEEVDGADGGGGDLGILNFELTRQEKFSHKNSIVDGQIVHTSVLFEEGGRSNPVDKQLDREEESVASDLINPLCPKRVNSEELLIGTDSLSRALVKSQMTVKRGNALTDDGNTPFTFVDVSLERFGRGMTIKPKDSDPHSSDTGRDSMTDSLNMLCDN